MDSGNRFMVTPMKLPGLFIIHEKWVTKPMTRGELLNLAAWALATADPSIGFWIGSSACCERNCGENIRDFKAMVKSIVLG